MDSLRTLDPVFLTPKWEITIPWIANSMILNNRLCILVLGKIICIKFNL